MKRPWTAWVRSIGPTFTFSTEAGAVAKARALVEHEYHEVVVWGPVELPLRRRIFRAGVEYVEQFEVDHWAQLDEGDEGSVAVCDLCGQADDHTHTIEEYGFPTREQIEDDEAQVAAMGEQ